MKWVYVIVIFVLLIFSQSAVDCYENVGVKFNNLTRLPKNGTCTNNCKYYMNLCLSFSENLNCSLFNETTLSWEIKPEESKKFELDDPLTDSDEMNPIEPLLKTWKMQEVVLLADIWRDNTTPIFIEQLRMQARLPSPINDFDHIDRLQIKNCSVYFCLGLSLYMWCDNIAGCIGIPLHTTTVAVQPSFTSHSLSSLTSSAAHLQNTSKIYKRMTTIETMMTSKPYETRTTYESSKSLNMYTPASASAGSVSTTYGTSSLVVTTSTFKTTTGVEPSKSVFAHTSYDYNTTSDMHSPSRLVVTTSTYEIMSTTQNPRLSSPSSPVSSCAFEACGQGNPNDKFACDGRSNKLIENWWFWLCMVAAVLLILFVVVMVKVKYKERKSREIQIKDTSKYKNVEVLENYTSADQVGEQATSV